MTLDPAVQKAIKQLLREGADPGSLAALYQVPLETVKALKGAQGRGLFKGPYQFLLETCRLVRQNHGEEAVVRLMRRIHLPEETRERLDRDLAPVKPEDQYE